LTGAAVALAAIAGFALAGVAMSAITHSSNDALHNHQGGRRDPRYARAVRFMMRSLIVLALPGAIFGFLTRITPPVFDSLDSGFTIDEPWLDALAALVLAAAVALLVARAGIEGAGSQGALPEARHAAPTLR
jgi:hypothetical protein